MDNNNLDHSSSSIRIVEAKENDVPLLLSFIKGLAEYERLPHECVATEELLRETLFGKRRYAESVIAYHKNVAAGFALFFHNYSTFLARPGIYLEDLFVLPEMRGKKIGRALLIFLARLAQERKCGRLEWSALKWNSPAISFYEKLGAIQLDEWTTFRLTGEALTALADI
jgi:GNAT superfamily N-acetyltransferase